MSYINEALKKAQEEKDNRYGKLDYVVSASSAKRRRPWQKRSAVFVAIVVIGVGAALLSVKFFFAPDPAVQSLPESSAERGAVVADSPVKQHEAMKTERPAAARVTDEKTRKKGGAKPASAKSKQLRDEKKAEIRRRYEDAALAQRKGNFSKAKILYGEVLSRDADNVKALNNLGVVYLAERQEDKALAFFRRAVVLKRDYADPYYNMACLYAQKNDIDQSLWYLKIAISIDKEVKNWVKKDDDMKNVVTSPKFQEIDGGAKN